MPGAGGHGQAFLPPQRGAGAERGSDAAGTDTKTKRYAPRGSFTEHGPNCPTRARRGGWGGEGGHLTGTWQKMEILFRVDSWSISALHHHTMGIKRPRPTHTPSSQKPLGWRSFEAQSTTHDRRRSRTPRGRGERCHFLRT